MTVCKRLILFIFIFIVYEEWQIFYDIFSSAIHNENNLSKVQKLQYLKCSLTGEAAKLLVNISTAEANYDEAWLKLTKRYKNKRYNCIEIMKILFSIKVLPSESASGIKNILDTISTYLKALNNIGVTRSEFIKAQRICFNCLSKSHLVKNCRQSMCFRRCGRRHHTLLHYERGLRQASDTTTSSTSLYTVSDSVQNNEEKKVVVHFAKQSRHNNVATAMAKAKSANDYSQIIRVLVDLGSEASFITEATVQLLGLKRSPINGLVSGVGDGQTRTNSKVSLNLESLHNPEFTIQIEAFVLSSLTSFLPASESFVLNWPEINNLPLADPNYGLPGKIDMILGVEVHSELIIDEVLRHPLKKGPFAQKSQLGWLLSGRIVSDECPGAQHSVVIHAQVRENVFLTEFWEIEREPDKTEKRLTKEERRSEEIFEETTRRDSEGCYIVRLPFKSPNPECLSGHTREIAIRRLKYLEKSLSKKPSLYVEYKRVMDNYIEQHHMMEITDETELNNSNVVYLPYHAVIRYYKETTKVRPVFDASCKGVNDVSLNDNLRVGPKLQQDLRHILMRWRCHRICIVADLVQMYRQIRVANKDTIILEKNFC